MQIAGLLVTEKAVSAVCHKNGWTRETGAGAKGEGFVEVPRDLGEWWTPI